MVKITPDGFVRTFAASSESFANGTGANAKFSGPFGMLVFGWKVFVANKCNPLIRGIGLE